jgi:hypothetical protein
MILLMALCALDQFPGTFPIAAAFNRYGRAVDDIVARLRAHDWQHATGQK